MNINLPDSNSFDPEIAEFFNTAMNELETDKLTEEGEGLSKTNQTVNELFLFRKMDLSKNNIEAKKLEAVVKEVEGNSNKLEDYEFLWLRRNGSGSTKLAAHEDIIDILKDKNIFLNRGMGENRIERLNNRNIVYIGLNQEQHNRIFNVASRVFDQIATDYLSKKEEAEVDELLQELRLNHDIKRLHLSPDKIHKLAKWLSNNDAAKLFRLNAAELLAIKGEINKREKARKEKSEKAEEIIHDAVKKEIIKREIRKQNERLSES